MNTNQRSILFTPFRSIAGATSLVLVLSTASTHASDPHAAPHGSIATPSSSAHAPAAPGPNPAEVLKRLVEGNEHYVAGKLLHPNLDATRRESTAKEGQHPIATVLSCSDSRVPPELIFDQGVGDVFSVRVAGNVADTDELGTVEYGVDHLHTPVLVVMGHTKCGAVTAVATDAEVHGHIPELVDNIKPAVDEVKKEKPNASKDEIIPEAIKANVFQAMADTIKKSKLVRERLKGNNVEIVGAVYDIASGKVEWLGKHPKEKDLIVEGDKTPEPAHGAAHGQSHGSETTKETEKGHGEGAKSAEHGATVSGHGDSKSAPAPGNGWPIGMAIVAFLSALGGGLAARFFGSSKKDDGAK